MKYAFVTPRYGAEISSGPEHACRLFAEHLSQWHDVHVLTTCAQDPLTWKNEYGEGADRIRGVQVRRFAVSQQHDRVAFEQLSGQLMGHANPRALERDWVSSLGPVSAGLIEYLKRQHRSYDAVVFFSLYHATTVRGTAACERSILFPYLRLDAALRLGIWADVVSSVRAVGYLSAAERSLAHNFLHVRPRNEEVVGMGVNMPVRQTYPRHQQNPADEMSAEDEQPVAGDEDSITDYLGSRGVLFRRRHRLYGPIVLCSSRLQPSNGSEELLEYFESYAAQDGDTALVLMGVKLITVPERPFIRMAGILPDRERMVAYEAADVTLAPEPDDLIAASVLESFAAGTPVLATARNPAAVELCRQSNAGLYYADREEFVEALRVLMTDARLRERLGASGRQYIRQHHLWDAVAGRFERLVARVRS